MREFRRTLIRAISLIVAVLATGAAWAQTVLHVG